ncbi:hypothetical protein [Thermomonospora umbrina]|uniref:Uncharacterized protein n=1 Tax=Thermomonospora umbrina TaxID=111806 RepID=A0A3D9SVW0_9ACTN|nr:hypothetical protein [Thermomonospora umbrina]REE95801.1 hypothetical protein DFJ69_1212 [Thermomonospora umbrina]
MTAVEQRHRTGGRRLSPGARKSVLVVHVIASVALLGEVWGLVILNLAAALTDEVPLAHSAYRLMSFLVFGGGIPLSMIALVTGIALGLGTHWGLARHWWVAAKLGLLVATVLVGMLAFTPEAMAAATEHGVRPDAGGRWRQVAAVSVQLLMLVTATALSVYKPKGRIRDR